ncbi:MAG: type II 3-dehydroquinate dehydratase [Candidatus Omnitrophica bacterium]|jgi:3-dehydroquinate dehydratase-2|nr:type II 3-dehydroquinate dehydratase [Candidatus Omnitrophota bacterium]MDD5080363.1 type II 3-dehydroquinate dehydratase [Candidatus Omnitrophota bacterium]MDD5441344.1 type II 3-dehydroquinate dehydratase [Candidatus Omnitrophota bacterium]
MKKLLVIHGPNLHMLGKREPGIYGAETLNDIDVKITKKAKDSGLDIEIQQYNSEGDIVERITRSDFDYLIINPAAYTHTSVAVRDALLSAPKRVIEVHLSNIYKREDFRKKSLVSDIVEGVISGFGAMGYIIAVDVIAQWAGNDS